MFIVVSYLLRVPVKTDTGHFFESQAPCRTWLQINVHDITVTVTATVTTQTYVSFSRRIGILSLFFADFEERYMSVKL